MEDEILANFGDSVSVAKVVGSGGDFIVQLDKDVIFSKNDLIGTNEPRFPKSGEITELIKAHKA